MVKDWIDVHAHFYPPETPERRRERLIAMQEGGWVVSEPPGWDVKEILAYMDQTGIAMQMLSNIPKKLEELQRSNDYGASLVREYPSRFGFLAALPTDNVDAALAEIARVNSDGFAVTCHYNGVYLSDSRLDPMWAELDRRGAVVFAHPDAYTASSLGRPSPLIEVAFETTRTVVDMIYMGVFRRFPNFKLVLAHCGGGLPVLAGRLLTLGFEKWIPNPSEITRDEMATWLRKFYLDTAAVCPNALAPALEMTSHTQIVYGSDCGVPCSTSETMNANLAALLAYRGLTREQIEEIGRNALKLFPAAATRLNSSASK